MPKALEQLTAGEWAVLGLVDEEPTHGFALARALEPDGDVGRVWSVRRPLVYRALETLEGMGLVAPAGTRASPRGPQRTIFAATAAGQRALGGWLGEPVMRVRDARSMLMLKLLFLTRRDAGTTTLLAEQRAHFASLARTLAQAAEATGGFDRTLLLWRLETTTAAVRFTEAMLAARSEPD